MSGPDLHPEELLDKAAAGSLTESERVWLDQHLASCTVCRFEQQVRADFVAAASVVNEAEVDDLVARALAGMPSKKPALISAGNRRAWSTAIAACVALFTVSGFAAVGQVTGVLPKLVAQVMGTSVEVEPVPSRVLVPVVPRVKVPEPELPLSPEPVVVPEPVAPAPVPAPVVRAPVSKRVVAPAPVVVAAATGPMDSAELFAAGNAARIRGDRGEAALRYGELLRKFPQSDEARLTHATLGRMLLDSGDAKGALEQLDTYLSLGDETLREEAMSARARSLALLGRPRDEAQAWQALLQSYPDSVHAERALGRLRELGAR